MNILLLLFNFSCHILKSKDSRVFNWQILIRVPFTILQRLDASVLLKSGSGIIPWRVHLIWKIHILPLPFFYGYELFMLLRNFIQVLLKVRVCICSIAFFTVVSACLRFLFFIVAAHYCNLHLVKHPLQIIILLSLELLKCAIQGILIQLICHIGSCIPSHILIHLIITIFPLTLGSLDIIISQIGLLSRKRIRLLLHLIGITFFTLA